MSLSILKTGTLLQQLQGTTTEVQVTQMKAVNQLTHMLQTLSDHSLSESEKLVCFAKIAGYIQVATLFLGPLLVLSAILAAGGALSALLSQAAFAGAEGCLHLTQGVLTAIQGGLETATSEKKANLQKNKATITALQINSEDILTNIEKELEKSSKSVEGGIKVINNQEKIANQQTIR